jgi:hypothetical protein
LGSRYVAFISSSVLSPAFINQLSVLCQHYIKNFKKKLTNLLTRRYNTGIILVYMGEKSPCPADTGE